MPAISQTIKNPGLDPVQWQQTCNEMLGYLRSVTPVRTGDLKKGWHMNVGGSTAAFYNEMPYASYVNDGTPKMAPRDMTGQMLDQFDKIASVTSKNPGVNDENLSQAEYRELRQKQLGWRYV